MEEVGYLCVCGCLVIILGEDLWLEVLEIGTR